VVFDAAHPYGSGADQSRTITSLDQVTLPTPNKNVLVATLDASLNRNGSVPASPLYVAGYLSPATQKSAGIGVLSGDPEVINGIGARFYDADMRSIKKTYDDAYVEFVAPRNGEGAVPHLPASWFDTVADSEKAFFSQVWFKNYQSMGVPSPPYDDAPHNYFHILGASGMTSRMGRTAPTWDWTYIFDDSIVAYGNTNSATQAQIHNINQDTTCHELGHQFVVNLCNQPGLHDSRPAWCDSSQHCALGGSVSQDCVMNSGDLQPIAQVWDGVSRFCAADLLSGDPLCPDPIPPHQRDGAIRTDFDPQ
jgi:hypothetical protein